MNKQEATKQAEKLQLELDKLKEIINKPDSKLWIPETGDEVYYIKNSGNIDILSFYTEWTTHHGMLKARKLFKTKEEAEFTREKELVLAELQNFADEYNEYEFDWTDTNQRTNQKKYYIYFNSFIDELSIGYTYLDKGLNIYFTAYTIAVESVDTVGEDRIKKYLFGIEC